MSVIVTDRGFGPDDWNGAIAPLASRVDEPGVDLAPDAAWADVAALLAGSSAEASGDGEAAAGRSRGAGHATPALIRIAFPTFADGRGFTLARRLRQAGYAGRLRAAGHVLADQYAMTRRSGFDEVEIPDDLAVRQPEASWRARVGWRTHDYQSRLGRRGFPSPA
jgi:uncharacterized protein (DUF934 family)